jgi:hypothetical protein
MQRATIDDYDIMLDTHYWRLVSLAEWDYFMGMRAGAGLTWRDADATKHRLVQQADIARLHAAIRRTGTTAVSANQPQKETP